MPHMKSPSLGGNGVLRALVSAPRAGSACARWVGCSLVVLLGTPDHGRAEPLVPHDAAAAACHVRVTRLSYDDPGSDDHEFIELRVEAEQVSATLGECGIEELWLVNGSTGSCQPYRQLRLGDVVPDPRGFIVICSKDSPLHHDVVCDVTSNLPNGWLQNGPDDGLWLMGAVEHRYVYASQSGACSSGAVELPTESPAVDDDVSAWCNGAYVLVELSQAPLRSTACPAGHGRESLDAGEPLPSNPGEPPAARAVPGFDWANGWVVRQEGTVEALPWDAGSPVPAQSARPTRERAPPPSVGCELSRGAVRGARPIGWALLGWTCLRRWPERRPRIARASRH